MQANPLSLAHVIPKADLCARELRPRPNGTGTLGDGHAELQEPDAEPVQARPAGAAASIVAEMQPDRDGAVAPRFIDDEEPLVLGFRNAAGDIDLLGRPIALPFLGMRNGVQDPVPPHIRLLH